MQLCMNDPHMLHAYGISYYIIFVQYYNMHECCLDHQRELLFGHPQRVSQVSHLNMVDPPLVGMRDTQRYQPRVFVWGGETPPLAGVTGKPIGNPILWV